MTDTWEKDEKFAAMAAYLPDGTPLPEPKAAEEKPSGDGNPDGEKKELSKSALKKLAKGKVRYVAFGSSISYGDSIAVSHTTNATLYQIANRVRKTRKISQSGASQAKIRKQKLPQRKLPMSIRRPKAKRRICRCYQWTTVTIRRLSRPLGKTGGKLLATTRATPRLPRRSRKMKSLSW
jgi:hypothetical protein